MCSLSLASAVLVLVARIGLVIPNVIVLVFLVKKCRIIQVNTILGYFSNIVVAVSIPVI